MNIEVFGSSSKGNAYKVSDGERSLLLEAGIKLNKIKCDWQSIDGCLITHEHGDHSKYANELLKTTSIDIFTSIGTQEALKLPSYRVHCLEPLKQKQIGNWSIIPFPTEHDAVEPFGYLIHSSKTKEKLLFATDTYYIRYKFKGITHLMIECNYALDILNENVKNGRIGAYLKNRVLKSHFSLENVKEFIKATDLSELKEVWLLHLSDSNSNAERFKKEIQVITGTPVYIA
ncbi:MBL fold metallo-hydrolase [Carnobacterium maltaromaticum]|uniref:MBL fold metallo-hydrolase n=1 Tax=Carnobacterium maltaromaticum TaxID=2751 RepID=UPI0039BE52BD